MNAKLLLTVSALLLWLVTTDVAARQVSSTYFIVDCSGCSDTQKKGRAIVEPWDSLLGDASRRTFNVDVTDFHRKRIIRYQITLVRVYRTGGIARAAKLVSVPSSKQLEFSKALEVVETLLFFGPDDDDFGGVDPIPTHYRSAFDLVGDNGSQELLFSDMFNNTQWPDTASELLAGSTIKDALESATQMLLDFLGQDIKVVTEAFDGTIIIVEGDLIQGQDGKIRVLWQVAENGLRLADGNILNESTGSSGTSIAGRGRTSADQLYNGLSGRGFRITIRTTATTESSCTWTFSCTGSECTLTMRGGC